MFTNGASISGRQRVCVCVSSSNVTLWSLHRFFVSECVPGVGGFNGVCRVAGGVMRGLWMVPTQTGKASFCTTGRLQCIK